MYFYVYNSCYYTQINKTAP
ncbi:hypothetical protein ES1_22910 [[Eubacterium] siraeum V10Sc8a]|uniref:Uncharacterized protein n=1 Tax=[Eubacterium] siraeum V10Sc8a TaxID=717961 RepID=D4MMZ5_9FIRM|nr:hypothetical protein ES1_22910 [[Eubacterium] siraeum V10Sc8a]